MALRFGKKKQPADTDWSEDALLDDAPPESTDTAPVDAATPGTTEAIDSSEEAAPARKKKALLMAGIAAGILLLLGGAAAYFLLLAPAEPEEEPPPIVVGKAPEPEGDVKVVKTDPPTKAVAPPGTETINVPAGDRGIAPTGAEPPILQRSAVTAPHMVPGPGVPEPVPVPEGLAGTPGRYGSRIVRLVPITGTPEIAPGLQQQLDYLWQQGADAKHRGDIEGARSAWQAILELKPGHPGIQSAIDKLPKE